MTIVDSSTANTSLSVGDTMTSNATANTKTGSDWKEAIASTSEETYWITLVLKSSANDESFLIDIGVGATASEVVKIPNIPYFGNTLLAAGILSVKLPLTIASGARVAIRCQSTGSSVGLEYMIYLSNDDSLGTSTVNENWGAQTGTSTGSDVDPGGTDNTKGGYRELIASTGITADYLVVFFGNSDNNAQTNQSYLVDIATSSGPEVVEIDNIPFVSNAGEISSQPYGFFHSIASSSRVAAACQSNNAAAAGTNDRLIDVTIIAFDMTAPAGGGGGTGGIKLVGNGGGLVGLISLRVII